MEGVAEHPPPPPPEVDPEAGTLARLPDLTTPSASLGVALELVAISTSKGVKFDAAADPSTVTALSTTSTTKPHKAAPSKKAMIKVGL